MRLGGPKLSRTKKKKNVKEKIKNLMLAQTEIY